MYSNPEYVTGHYRDASKLNARVALRERFSTDARGLQRWVFDHFDLPQEARILGVGSGRRHRGKANRRRRVRTKGVGAGRSPGTRTGLTGSD